MGFSHQTAPLPSASDAARLVIHLLYGADKGKWQTREKHERNAEIYRRHLAGEDSVELGQAFGLWIGASETLLNMNATFNVSEKIFSS